MASAAAASEGSAMASSAEGRGASRSSVDFAARRFCFTIFNELDWLYNNVKHLSPNIKFIVFQEEEAPDTKKRHIQGYAELKNPTKVKSFQNYFKPCGRFHVEASKGSSQDNIKYCTKAESRVRAPVQRGEPSEQGRRTDLEGIASDIIGGKDLKAVSEDNPKEFIRYTKGLQTLAFYYQQPEPRGEPCLYYLWGGPGCGKSYVAREMCNSEFDGDVYWCSEHTNGWMDGYAGQKVIAFDDFTGKFPLNDMLKLLDYGALRLPIKGGYVNIKADTFVFTSNFPVEHQYLGDRHQDAWLSRFNGERYDNVTIWDEERVKEIFKDLRPQKPKRLKRADAAAPGTILALMQERMCATPTEELSRAAASDN